MPSGLYNRKLGSVLSTCVGALGTASETFLVRTRKVVGSDLRADGNEVEREAVRARS